MLQLALHLKPEIEKQLLETVKTLEYLLNSDDMEVIKIPQDILDKALEIYKKILIKIGDLLILLPFS